MRQVLRELVMTGAVPRVTRWGPVALGWLLAGLVLAWRGDDVSDAGSAVLLLRLVAVLLALGVVSLLDDAAADVLAPAPLPLAWRRGARLALAAIAVAVPWTVALLWIRPGQYGVGAAALTLECATITALGLAVSSGVARWSDAVDPGLAAGPALIGAVLLALALPERWALVASPGAGWRDAHLRWAVLLGAALAAAAWSIRDPAARTPAWFRPARGRR